MSRNLGVDGWNKLKMAYVRARPYLAATMLAIAIVSTVMAWKAMSTPVSIRRESIAQTYKQEVSFDYSVVPKKSVLYPTPTPLPRFPKYLTKITDQFSVAIKSTITTQPGLAISGTCKVLLRLEAEDLWQKEYVLKSQAAFTGSGKVSVLDEVLTIPLKDILAFTDAVAKEADVFPSEYSLTVIPVISAITEDGKNPFPDDFRPFYAFGLTGRELSARGLAKPEDKPNAVLDLTQERITSVKKTVLDAQVVRLFALILPVPTARWIFGLAALLGYAVPFLMLRRQLGKRHVTEVQRIERKYGSRTIKVGSLNLNKAVLSYVSTFQELVQMADAREQVIVREDYDNGGSYRYCVVDGERSYCYVPQGKKIDNTSVGKRMATLDTDSLTPGGN